MKEALLSIMDRMNKSDDLLKNHGAQVHKMEASVKSLKAAMQSVKKLEGNQMAMNKQIIEHSNKIMDLETKQE